MTKPAGPIAGLALLLALTGHAAGQPAENPDWPCVQRKVPEISAAAVWTGPALDEHRDAWRDDPVVAPLVERLAARRTPVEEAGEAIAAVAEGPQSNDRLTMLFAGLLEKLNRERGEVIAGIERYGRNQKQLAERLREQRAELDALRERKDADSERIRALTEEIAWDARIFDDRQKSLSYVCEVPILIEQRLFALARDIQAALE